MISAAHFILDVRDQEASRRFWEQCLGQPPALHVPGMTEFRLREGVVLGLMPERGIRVLLGERLPDPAAAAGVPRAELYLVVDDPAESLARCLRAGASLLSEVLPRSWGHRAGYCLDPDGHVIAFASVGTGARRALVSPEGRPRRAGPRPGG